jgi:hypothetical protein
VPDNAFLEMSNTFQRRIPSAFQLARNKPLGRIDSLIAAGGERSLIACFLKFPAHCATDVIIRLHRLISRPDGRLDGMPGDRLHDLGGNRPVDADAADPNAKPTADVAPALVTVRMAGTRSIKDPHRPAAAPRRAGTGRGAVDLRSRYRRFRNNHTGVWASRARHAVFTVRSPLLTPE